MHVLKDWGGLNEPFLLQWGSCSVVQMPCFSRCPSPSFGSGALGGLVKWNSPKLAGLLQLLLPTPQKSVGPVSMWWGWVEVAVPVVLRCGTKESCPPSAAWKLCHEGWEIVGFSQAGHQQCLCLMWLTLMAILLGVLPEQCWGMTTALKDVNSTA